MIKKRLLRDKNCKSNRLFATIGSIIILSLIIVFGYIIACGLGYSGPEGFSKQMTERINQTGIKGNLWKYGYTALDKLGFNTGYTEVKEYGTCWGFYFNKLKTTAGFFGRFLLGLLIGTWVFLAENILNGLLAGIAVMRKKNVTRNRWLMLIGNSVWKILAIAVGYAILMQVPILNVFIQIISLEKLGLNKLLVSFILAFYIGLGPAWIEDYTKYRIRMKAEKAVAYASAAGKIERARVTG